MFKSLFGTKPKDKNTEGEYNEQSPAFFERSESFKEIQPKM